MREPETEKNGKRSHEAPTGITDQDYHDSIIGLIVLFAIFMVGYFLGLLTYKVFW